MKRTLLLSLSALALSLALVSSPGLAAQTKLLAEGTFSAGTQIITFDVPDAPLSLSIKVLNGTQKGSDRVSSALVELNGKAIYRQKDLNQNVGSLVGNIVKEDTRPAGNRLTVTVNGRPEATLKVTILGEYSDPPPPTTTVTMQAWYQDFDRDGYGAGAPLFLPADAPPPGLSTLRGGDCNDNDPAVYPGNGCP